MTGDRPPSPVERVVLLFEGRTGSSHLYSMLKQHPRIDFRPEHLMDLRHLGWPSQRAWMEDFFGGRTDDAIDLADLTRGFKTKLRDIADIAAFADLLVSQDVLIVRMRRRNRVKQAVSWIRARRLAESTGAFNLTRRMRLGLPPFAIEPLDLVREIQDLEQREATLDRFVGALPLPRHDLAYEDLLVDRKAELRRLLDRLGQPAFEPMIYHLKHTADDLRLALPNHIELREAFRGTPYQQQLDEVLAAES